MTVLDLPDLGCRWRDEFVPAEDVGRRLADGWIFAAGDEVCESRYGREYLMARPVVPVWLRLAALLRRAMRRGG